MDPNCNVYKPMTTRKVLPFWIECWLISSGVICLLDVIYTMLRPYTLRGGFLGGVYFAWNLYSDVDKRYADTADIVTCASGRVMLVEITLDFVAVYLARKRSRHALMTAFMTTAFVFWKTVWFLILYIHPPHGAPSYFTENLSAIHITLIFWIPNGVWVVLPFFVMLALWNRLALPLEEEKDEPFIAIAKP